MSLTRERDLRPAVIAWLKEQRLDVVGESMLYGGYCDVVGFQFAGWNGRIPPYRTPPRLLTVVAVELKLENATSVLRQAANNQRRATLSYAAMPIDRVTRMTEKALDRFRYRGVGVLGVGEQIWQIVQPKIGRDKMSYQLSRRFWRYKRRGHLL